MSTFLITGTKPGQVRHLTLYGDDDMARQACERLTAEGWSVTVLRGLVAWEWRKKPE